MIAMSRRSPLPALLVCLAMAMAMASGLAQDARAHSGEGLVPDAPGLAITAAAAGGWWHGDSPSPARRLAGVTSPGDRPTEQRGWQLEHGTVGAGLRWTRSVAARVAVGWHGDGHPHVEAAWLQFDFAEPFAAAGRVGPANAANASTDIASDESAGKAVGDNGEVERAWSIGAGRSRVPLGATVERAGHFDRYSAMPLAKRAAFNGDWIEDGVNLRWARHDDAGPRWLRALEAVDLGLWRARRFPGANAGPIAPLLHLRARFAPVTVDGFATRMRPDDRGGFVAGEDGAHSHSVPTCDGSLVEVVCFRGRVDLIGASANWATPISGLTIDAAAIVRRERGDLSSANGSARYRGRSHGGWIDLTWSPSGRWETGLRHEWLSARNALVGTGATRVAGDAALLPYRPSWRTVAMVGHRPHRDWRIGVEAGRESIGERASTLVALRLAWMPAPWALAAW